MKKKEVSWPGRLTIMKQETAFNRNDQRRYEMHKEKIKDRGEKAKCTDSTFSQTGQGMFEMMKKCCMGQSEFPDCSTMMKGMKEAMRNQTCCTPNEDAAESERRKK
jgi:hypothetical protein